MKTIDEMIKDLEMVKDDLYDHDFRTMADKITEVVKELDEFKPTVEHLIDEVESHAWYDSSYPFNVPEGYLPVLARFEANEKEKDTVFSRYYLVAQFETAAQKWTRAIDHEPINDKVVRWKYIR